MLFNMLSSEPHSNQRSLQGLLYSAAEQRIEAICSAIRLCYYISIKYICGSEQNMKYTDLCTHWI